MNHLCSVLNQTYATINVHDRRIISVEDNELFGLLGKKIDDLLIKKHLRKCNLIGEPNSGERLDNGTWTGNLGLMQKGDAILYLKSEAHLIDTSIEKWMHYLFPFYREKFVIIQEIGQDMEKASIKENRSDVLNCFNFGLILLFSFIFANLISFSIWISFKLFLSYQNFRKKRKTISISGRIKKILINLLNGQWNLNHSKLTKLSLFILFYSLHIWFIKLIIANNIKTDKVIVDHSILIKDENDALHTERVFCFTEGETELSIVLNSNSSSNILSKLYDRKNIAPENIKGTSKKKGDRCLLKKSPEELNIDLGKIFSIISENAMWLITSFVGNTRTGDIIWFNSKPIFEMDYHMIIKNQKDLINSYNKIILLYTESGIIKRFFDSFSLNSNAYSNSHTVYRTLEDFIKGNSKFSALNKDSFKLLFIIYISFCLIILIINLLHCLVIKIDKNLFISFYTKFLLKIRSILFFIIRSILFFIIYIFNYLKMLIKF